MHLVNKLSLSAAALGACLAGIGIGGKVQLDSSYKDSVPHPTFQRYLQLGNQLQEAIEGNLETPRL